METIEVMSVLTDGERRTTSLNLEVFQEIIDQTFEIHFGCTNMFSTILSSSKCHFANCLYVNNSSHLCQVLDSAGALSQLDSYHLYCVRGAGLGVFGSAAAKTRGHSRIFLVNTFHNQ